LGSELDDLLEAAAGSGHQQSTAAGLGSDLDELLGLQLRQRHPGLLPLPTYTGTQQQQQQQPPQQQLCAGSANTNTQAVAEMVSNQSRSAGIDASSKSYALLDCE
jgi:hypothetical protein